ncbi:Hypothetical predicted protein [Pelobates cultripes]|uniref:Uncharacterized protein n=1 Tax=Pelobates cultripes TaxID=61616 RepID=A0AAD1WA72_PELCU|nr:Hypothetical predicted protein [Pelobates cultripes]
MQEALDKGKMPAKLVRLGSGSGHRPNEDAFSGAPGYDILDKFRSGSSGAVSLSEGVLDDHSLYVKETLLGSPMVDSHRALVFNADDPGEHGRPRGRARIFQLVRYFS